MLNIIQIWPVVPEKKLFKVFFILDSFKGNWPRSLVAMFVKHYLCPLPTLCPILSLYLFWFKSYGYLTFDLEGWPWPWHAMSKICSFIKYTCIIIIKSLSLLDPKLWHTINLTFDLAEWPWHYNVITQNMRLHEIHLYTKYQMFISIGSKVMAKTLYLTFDLEEWPWPCDVSTQNVQPHKIYHSCQKSFKSNQWFQRRRFLNFSIDIFRRE